MDGLSALDGTPDTSLSESLDSIGYDARTVDLPLQFDRACQHTLRNAISCAGVGLHSGRKLTLTLHPAAADTGIVFRRTDLGVDILAHFDNVVDTRFSTVVAAPGNAQSRLGTVEHVMAALAGCGIDNVRIDVDGPEIPVLDGSAAPFVFLIDCAGRERQSAPRRTIEVLKRVRVEAGEAFAELRPAAEDSLSLSLSIAFPARAIGRQAYSMILTDQDFRCEIAPCRTFTLLGEIEALRRAGLAQGGSLDNAIVVDDDRVLNPAGLRRRDEFVRHKMLDAVGDLALAGQPIRGAFIGHRSGHSLNNRLLRSLMADQSAWRISGHGMVDEKDRIAA